MIPNFLHPKNYLSLLSFLLMLAIPVLFPSPFITNLFTSLFVFAALAMAWNIVGGFAGQLSLGHAVYYGIGGYTASLLTINFGISPWIGMGIGAIISGVIAIIISYPTLRLKGPFFSLASIAILEVVRLLVIHEEEFTGGSSGVSIPLNIGWEWIVFRDKLNYVFIAFALFLVVLWISWLIRTSRLGFYLIAVREREDAAKAVGINTARVQVYAATVSAFLTSIIGSFHITYLTFIDPESAFSLQMSIQIAMFTLIGGIGTLTGPIVGTFIVLPIAELARGWLSASGNGVHGLIYGLILVIVVLTVPRGIVGVLKDRVLSLVEKLPNFGRLIHHHTQQVQQANQHLEPQLPTDDVILKAENLHKRFGGLQATNNVSFSVYRNEILGIIGPNGAGKTTVFNQLSGFIIPDEGNITFKNRQGEWVNCKSPYEFARAGLGRTFQITQPFTGLSVLENIMIGAFLNTSSPEEARHVALEIAEKTELSDLIYTEAKNLTIGGMKRLEIARALATQPHILLLDEVLAGLNPTDIEKAIKMIKNIRNSGVTIVLIEHMMQATMALSDRIIVINEGKILTSGKPKEVIENPEVIEAYLGKEFTHA